MKKLIIPVALSVLSLTAYSQAWMKGGNNPSGSPFSLGSNTNDPINFITNGFQRMIINNGTGAFNQGQIAIGNNLPSTFSPQARFHIHQDGRTEYIRFTNNITGPTATDGFIMGFDNNPGFTVFKQLEQQPIAWFLPNTGGTITEYMRMMNGTGFIGIHTSAPTRTLDVNGKVRVQDLSSNGTNSGVVTYFNDGTLQNLAFNNNANQALLGNGTFGDVAVGATNGTILTAGNQVELGGLLTHNTTIGKAAFNLRFLQSAANSRTGALLASRRGISIGPLAIPIDAPLCVFGPIHSTEMSTNGGAQRNTVIYSNTTQTGNPGIDPLQDGFRIVADRGFKGLNNDVLIFEKTDGNQPNPDGCIIFTNTGNDGNEELSMTIAGNGFVGIGQNFSGTGTPGTEPKRRLEVLENDDDENNEPQVRLTHTQAIPPASTIGVFSTGLSTDLQTTQNGDFAIMPAVDSVAFAGIDSYFNFRRQRSVGINTLTPGNTIEINSEFVASNSPNGQTPDPAIGTAPTGWAGLRFTDLNSASIVQSNPGTGVLSVDDNGDVIYVPGGAGGAGTVAAENGLSFSGPNPLAIQFGQTVGAPGNPANLLDDREVPMNNNNLTFTGNGVANRNIFSIGGFTTDGKFNVINNSQSYAATFHTDGTSLNPNFGNVVNITSQNTSGSTTALNVEAQTSVPNAQIIAADIQAFGNGASRNIGIQSVADGVTTYQNEGIAAHAENGAAFNVGGSFRGGLITDVTANTNYGVIAQAIGGNINYGIFASGGGNASSYAGYFSGDVFISGSGIVNGGTPITSDIQFKTNINPIQSASTIISQMQPKSFYFDTLANNAMSFSTAKQYGLIAQDVEQVLPELVKNVTRPTQYDTSGNVTYQELNFKTVNYNAFIALLIKSQQEQQSTIDSMRTMMTQMATILNSCCQNTNIRTQTNANNTNTVIDVELSDKDIIVLNQNVPNPFAEQTTIAYNVPEKSGFAQIIFNDMKGQIIKVVDIKAKGKGQLNVFANDLSTGMYTYSLYVDGKLIDTKKMVKTE